MDRLKLSAQNSSIAERSIVEPLWFLSSYSMCITYAASGSRPIRALFMTQNGQLIVALGCIWEKSGVNDAPKQDRLLLMAGSMLEKYHICGRRELVDEYSFDGYVASCHRFWKSEKRVVHDFFRPGSLKSKLYVLSKVNQNEAN